MNAQLVQKLEAVGFFYQASILKGGKGYWKYDSVGTLAAAQEVDDGVEFQCYSKVNTNKRTRVFLKGDAEKLYKGIVNIMQCH